MKIDPYCQRQRCNPLNVLFRIMFLALICHRLLRWDLHTRTAVVFTLVLARLSCYYKYLLSAYDEYNCS